MQRIIAERMTVRQLDMELKKLQENGGEEDTGIPLVDINPNIEDIVNNAEDINVIREPHDVASMLLPEGAVKEEPKPVEQPETPTKMPNKFFNFLEDEQANMNVIEPDEIFNMFNQSEAPIETPEQSVEVSNEITSTEPLLQPEPTIAETATQPEEKTETISSVELLDDLENIESPSSETPTIEEPVINPFAGLNEFVPLENPEPIENEVKTEQNTEQIQETPVLSEVNAEAPIVEPTITEEQPEPVQEIAKPEENITTTLEQPTLEPVLQPIEPENIQIEEQPVVTPIEQNNQILENTDTNAIIEEQTETTEPSNNEEVTPFKSIFFNTGEEEPAPVIEETPVINNTIEEVKPVVEEPLVDPLDSIVTLEPDYEARQKELAGKDLKTAINVVRETVSDLENRGFLVEIEEADLEDIYHITIKINKNDL